MGVSDGTRESLIAVFEAHEVLIDRLISENAKLRELAQQMYPAAKAFLQLGVQLGCNDTLSYDWWLQLRELGIEV